MKESFLTKLRNGFSPFKSRDPTPEEGYSLGYGSSYRPYMDTRAPIFNKTDLDAIYNRISIDVASIPLKHILVDECGMYKKDVDDDLNACLTLEPNIDQSPFAFIQDIILSMFDEGVVAIVITGGELINDDNIKVSSLKVARIEEWFPKHIRVRLYNQDTGLFESVVVPKSITAIIENPLYSIMNETNSTVRQLTRVLNDLDAVNKQSSSGKLDIIIQLPYAIKSPLRRREAEERREMLEKQLSGAQYGVAYIDGTERITQLNRAAENNLMVQVEYLSTKLYNQLGMAQSVFDGTADSDTMKNYHTRSINPFLKVITQAFNRAFFTRNSITLGHRIRAVKNPFDFLSMNEFGDTAYKLKTGEIMTGDELRNELSLKSADDPRAGELRNPTITASNDQLPEKVTDKSIEVMKTSEGETNETQKTRKI